MPLRQHTLPISGIDYPNRRGPTRREELSRCLPGDSLELQPEPDNPADPRAVKICSSRGVQVGYIPAERAARINAMLVSGRNIRTIFQGWADRRGFIRIAYDEDIPCLPH